MDFLPQNFIGLNNVSEGGTCHGCSGKAFPVEVVDDEVPNLGGKNRVGCFPSIFFFFWFLPRSNSEKETTGKMISVHCVQLNKVTKRILESQ